MEKTSAIEVLALLRVSKCIQHVYPRGQEEKEEAFAKQILKTLYVTYLAFY